MNITKHTTIYVGCPAYYKTGGTELAHQLVDEIRGNHQRAEIVYYNVKGDSRHDDNAINPAFKHYVNSYKILNDVVDSESNVLIAPEVKTDILNKFNNIQKCVWWMSVDNYQNTNGLVNGIKAYGLIRATKFWLKGNISFAKKSPSDDVCNLYQSEYARLFLEKHGISNYARLSDYLNDTYLDTTNVSVKGRENNILYNPRKGRAFTEKLISAAPNLHWVPICNMTTGEVRNLLLKSKVYIDFGNHPGKDRFPREAAISGCCVITDKKGSAANDIDVCIPNSYKFGDNDDNIQRIIRKIKDCESNFENNYNDFTIYREKILNEKEKFENDVKQLFTVSIKE